MTKKTYNFSKKYVFYLILGVFVFEFLLYPSPILANNRYDINQQLLNEGLIIKTWAMEIKNTNEVENSNIEENGKKLEQDTTASNNKQKVLPINNERAVVGARHQEITAYTSNIQECDSSPCITANGFNVCQHGAEDTVAANTLPFGTKLRIPELFGERIFIVRDRMNPRYSNRVDIWMKNRGDALKFGKRTAKIEILQ